jgi:prepilin-type N-terminal cleavage/methylation domain-containing protein
MRVRRILQDRRGDEGFTLVELLIVCVIIALLAAIAIPTFLGTRARAQGGVAAQDLHSAATAMEAFMTDTGHYGTATDVASQGESPKLSAGTTIVIVQWTDVTGYCFAALRDPGMPATMAELKSRAVRWFDSAGGGLQNAGVVGCPKTVGVQADWQTDTFAG